MSSRSRNASRKKSLPSRLPRPRTDPNPSRLKKLETELRRQSSARAATSQQGDGQDRTDDDD